MNLPYFRIISVLAAGAAAVLSVSCAASRSRTQSLQERTSVSQRTEVQVSTEHAAHAVSERSFREECVVAQESVPGGRAVVAVPLAALDSLPEGAGFGAREGRTAVAVRRLGDELVVEARSDSVARRVMRTKRFEVRTDRDSSDRRTFESAVSAADTLRSDSRAETDASRRRCAGWWWFAAGFVVCAVLLVRLRR